MQSESLVGSSFVKVVCLGAGQDVGRSCVCVTLADKTIVFDTGIHMLYSDKRRYPNFSQFYNAPQTVNDAVHLVLLTHFHLDHSGALPYLTEHHGYNGPIYTSTPTKSLLPLMLQDYRKVIAQQKKDKQKQEQFYIYSVQQVKNSTSKVKSIGLFQTINIDGIKLTSYYAGHVLGACMFHVQYKGLSVMYTGDYNSYADRHLGAASAPRLKPNLLITETTYATTIRDTKRDREKNMLQIITQTVQKGGKVLIPVFALGRAQQLSVLLQSYWKRTDSNIPIYFSPGLIQKANMFYTLFVDWQNQKIKQQFANNDNMFQFKKIKPFDKSLIRAQTPYVLFATPGMLHGGSSMQVFKEWCGDQKNTLIIPGYCVQGTLGNKLLKGVKQITIDKKLYQIKMRITNVSFSAHADAKGIINLIRNIDPQNIMFVHGDKQKMQVFKPIVQQQLNKPVYMPANFETCIIPSTVTEIIRVKQPPTMEKGYLMKVNSVNKEYCMIQEEKILDQINKILALNGDDCCAFFSPIECQYQCEFKEEDWQFLQQYPQKDLKFTYVFNPNSQAKQQQGVKIEHTHTKIEGSLSSVAKFIKDYRVYNKQEKIL